MTKELELPELPTPVNATYTDDGKHRAPWPPGTHFYTADQMRAYALATLAKTQEGGCSVLDHEISVWAGRMSTRDLIARYPEARAVHSALVGLRRALISQQKAPEGEPQDYCLRLLVAAGHITQELADQTWAIANYVVTEGDDHG